MDTSAVLPEVFGLGREHEAVAAAPDPPSMAGYCPQFPASCHHASASVMAFIVALRTSSCASLHLVELQGRSQYEGLCSVVSWHLGPELKGASDAATLEHTGQSCVSIHSIQLQAVDPSKHVSAFWHRTNSFFAQSFAHTFNSQDRPQAWDSPAKPPRQTMHFS